MTGYLTLRYQGYPVSVAMVNDEPWFVGKDIARILGCYEPAEILEEIMEGKDRLKAIGYCEACVHNYRADLINRIGVLILFQLLGKEGQTEKALVFRKWLMEDMYPVLKDGGIFLAPWHGEGEEECEEDEWDDDYGEDCGEDEWDEEDYGEDE